MTTFFCAEHICGGTTPAGCSQCHNQNNKFIIDAIKGEPTSLTSIAYNTGEIIERQRIIKLIIQAGYGLPDLIDLIQAKPNE